MPRHSQDQNQDPAASAVGNWKVQVQSPHCIPGMLGSCRHRHQPDAGCCRGELPTKFREIFTFLKTATCPQSYHWQAVLRIFSFSPSDVNMSRREISLTALLQKPQSCFKVAAVFTFVLQLAAVPAVVLPGSWMVFISHLKPERQDTSCALQPATTRTLSLYFYADKTRRHSEIFCWWFFVNWDCTIITWYFCSRSHMNTLPTWPCFLDPTGSLAFTLWVSK